MPSAQNIIYIDVHHAVRPDSRLMLSCFKRICSEEDFQDKVSILFARCLSRPAADPLFCLA